MLHRVLVTDTSQHQLFRGDCVNQAFVDELLRRNHYYRTSIRKFDRAKKHKTGGNLSFGLISPNLRFLVPIRRVFVRRRVGEWMISACMVPTVKHGGGGVMVWGCFAGDTVNDLFRIQGTLNRHVYHSILQRYAISSGLRLVGLSFVFQQDNDQHTSRLCTA